MKKILVFGAGGFIGTYLIDKLLELGYSVTASDCSEYSENYYESIDVEFIKIDITNANDFIKLENQNYDAVVNLAVTQPANMSSRVYDPRLYISVNVMGTINILDFCIRNKVSRIIYTTSHRNTQGLWKNKTAIKENDGRAIKYSGQYSMYSISETAAQDCILHYSEEYGLNSVIVRLPPVYGYGPHTEIFMNGKATKTGFQIFIDNAKEGKPLELWGKCDIGRDIIYVKDVANALALIIEKTNISGLYNIASGYKLSIREEAKIIADIFWRKDSVPIFIEKPEKKNTIEEFVYDINKAKKDLNWEPLYSFKEMLLDTIKESQKGKYTYLIEKRKIQLKNEQL